jgi:hypothetical protein
MLAWLAAAAVPLVLHLASRATGRSTDFSAMMFLPGGGAAAAAGGGRARGWLLLAVRSATLALLAVAAARPRLPVGWAGLPTAGLAGAERATVALVLDDAAGTGYAREGRSRSDEVTRVALGVLAGLDRGDRACVLPDPPPPGWADARPSADLSAAAAAVTGLRPIAAPADAAQSLDRAAAALADAAGSRQVVVVCDREATTWRNVTEAFARAWRHRPGAGAPPRVIVVAVGGSESDNVAVLSVRPVDPPMVRDMPGTVRVTVRNFGPAPRANLPLNLWTGPVSLADATVTVPARSTATVDVPVRLDRDGWRLLSAAVRGGGELAFDDRRDGVADVVPPARVLVVAPDAAGPLRAALAPNATAGRPGPDPAVVTVVDAAAWSASDLAAVDVVVLADVGDVSPDHADELRRFVDGGGGLLVAPGPHVSAADCDDALGDDGVGLLPATLGDPRPAVPSVGLRPVDGRQPALRFAPAPDADASRAAVRLSRSFTVVGRPAGPALLSTTDNRPIAIASDPPDGGRVVLFTVPLDDAWASWTDGDFYGPMVQSIVRWLAAGRSPRGEDHELPLGRPLVWTVDGTVDAGSAGVTLLPGNRREVVRVQRRGGRTELRYDRAAVPGTYRMRYRSGGREQATYFVVTPPPEASDLTPLSAQEWRTLAGRVGFERVDADGVSAAIARGRGGPEAWVYAVAGVLVLLAIEALLARRWSTAAYTGEGRNTANPASRARRVLPQ